MKKINTDWFKSAAVLGATTLYAPNAFAAFNLGAGDGANKAQPTQTPTCLFKSTVPGDPCTGSGVTPLFTTIANILIFLTGAIAVIMLIFGGLRYVTSGGNPSSTKAAKDTIMYGIIGLVVAILAYAIVNFVVGALKPATP